MTKKRKRHQVVDEQKPEKKTVHNLRIIVFIGIGLIAILAAVFILTRENIFRTKSITVASSKTQEEPADLFQLYSAAYVRNRKTLPSGL